MPQEKDQDSASNPQNSGEERLRPEITENGLQPDSGESHSGSSEESSEESFAATPEASANPATSGLSTQNPTAVDSEPRVGSSFSAIEERAQGSLAQEASLERSPRVATSQDFDSLIAGAGRSYPAELSEDSEHLKEEATLQEEDLQGQSLQQQSSAPRAPQGRSKLIVALVSIVAALLVAILFLSGVRIYDSYQDEQKAQEIEQEVQKAELEKAEAIKESSNPFSILVGKVDPPSEAPLESTVAADQVKIGATTLSVDGATLTAPSNSCSLTAITDICLAARGKTAGGDFEVFAVKDISRTRFLDDPVEFVEVKTPGGVIAASLAIDMGGAEGPKRFGALTASGSTGFIVSFPPGSSASRVEEVLKAATVIG